LNAGEIWKVPDLLWQRAVCPLYNLLKAFGICGIGHEANFTTRTKPRDLGIQAGFAGRVSALSEPLQSFAVDESMNAQAVKALEIAGVVGVIAAEANRSKKIRGRVWDRPLSSETHLVKTAA
jgi:hypothetical protein